jgi:hypothetical protein
MNVFKTAAAIGLATAMTTGPSFADRVALVGTSISMARPAGFVVATDWAGLVSAAGDARIEGVEIYLPWEDLVESYGPARDPAGLVSFGINSKGSSELLEVNGQQFLLLEGEGRSAGTKIWTAVFGGGQSSMLAFATTTGSGGSVLDRAAVLKILEGVDRISPPTTANDESVLAYGLTILPQAPFDNVRFVNAAVVLGDEDSLSLGFWPADGRSLEQLAVDHWASEYRPTVTEVRAVQFAGTQGIRVMGIAFLDRAAAQGAAVSYATIIGGQAVVLTASIPIARATDETLAVIDEIAKSVRPQTEADLATGKEQSK